VYFRSSCACDGARCDPAGSAYLIVSIVDVVNAL
jgi:hypothetical protein